MIHFHLNLHYFSSTLICDYEFLRKCVDFCIVVRFVCLLDRNNVKFLIVNLGILIFVQISDLSVEDYITATASKHPTYVPHTAGRYQAKRFRKAQCPIVERLTNSLMMHGRNNGKKLMAVRIVKHAMEIIHLLTDLNPIQVIVDAVINRYCSIINSVQNLDANYFLLAV